MLVWIDTRKEWIAKNPPDSRGYWQCYLQTTPLCPRNLDLGQLTLDHVQPRGSNIALRTDLDNLQPACVFCNSDKGSQSLDRYREKQAWKKR